jgi:Tfp pilus assembly protein PilF
LALRKLGRDDEARTVLQGLANSAAPGGPGAFQAHYAAGLGHLGLGDTGQARQELQQALAINPAHVGVRAAMAAVGGMSRN